MDRPQTLLGLVALPGGGPPIQRAVRVSSHRIVEVGPPRSVLARADRSEQVHVISAGAILPGFIDSHVHLTLTGLGLLGAQVGGCASVAELLEALTSWAERADPSWPVWAHGVSPGRLREGRCATRTELDRVFPIRPAFLVDRGHHAAYANSAALTALAEVDPIVVDADGSGTLIGAANTAAKRAFARLTPREARMEAIRRAAALAAGSGTTSVHALEGDWSGAEDPALIGAISDSLPVRTVVYDQTPDVERAVAGGTRRIGGDIWLDGGLYQRTAAFFEPYADDPSARGTLYYADEAIHGFMLRAHTAGLQIAVHAIGDRAIQQALDGYARAQAAYTRLDARHRIEHFTYATRAQHRQAADLGIALSLQANVPMSWEQDQEMTTRYLGAERAHRKTHVRRALDAGALVAGGSDADVRPMLPLAAMRYLVEDPRPGRSISLDEAVAMYTVGAAAAAFQEHLVGSIEPGTLADLVVLSGDPWQEGLGTVAVRATIVGGRVASGALPPPISAAEALVSLES
ncbi:MAG: amidohydrolase family protein [Chloroflexota bacterium]